MKSRRIVRSIWSTDFAKVVEFRIFSNIFVESRKSSQANKKQAYNCQTLASEILQPIKYSNISRTITWQHGGFLLMYGYYEWLYLHFLQLIMVRSMYFFKNNTLQTIDNNIQRGWEAIFDCFFLSFAGIVRGEEGVSLQSFGNRRPRCWKN